MALSAEELELLDGDISDAVDPALARTQAVTNGNLVRAAEGNPDQYAEDRKLGQETGVSTDIASRNRPQLEKLKYLDELELQALDETPVVQEWLKDDENSKIAYDDVAVLQKFERENSRTWWEAGEKAFENFGKTSMLGVGKAWDSIALAFLNEAKYGEGPGSVASMERMDERMDLTAEQRAKRQIWKDEAAANREKLIGERRLSIAAAEKEIGRLTPKGMTVMEESIRGGMQMAVDAGPGMLVSAITRGRINPTLGLLSAKVFGDSYGTAIEEGMTHEEAKRYAAIDTAIEIVTERLPMKRLEKVVGDLGGATPRSWAKKFMLEELTGEQLATAGQTLNSYMHDLDEELANAKGWEEILDIQGRRQAVTLFSTMIGGGSMAGTVKTVDYLASREQRAMSKLMKDTNKRRGSEFDQKRLDGLISLSQASKTNERAADMFEDLVNKMDPDQQIYIDAEAVDLLDNPPEFLTEQLKDGSGGTVAMPLSQFLKEIAGDEAALEIVRPFIKTNESHQNQTEAEQEDDSEYIKAILAKAAETQETKTAADKIYEQVTEQLVATGQLSTASARQAATLVPSQVTVQYEHLKSIGYKNEDGSEVTLEQVFADIGLEIVGPETDVAADFMTQEAEVVAEDTVTLEDGRTYEKQKTDPDHTMVLVDRDLLEEMWVDKIGPGPEYVNQISNRMEQYQEFTKRNDTGTFTKPDGTVIQVPKENVQVGNAYVRGPEPGYNGYISFGDGRHRARAMLEQGLKKIPISMDAESIAALEAIVANRAGQGAELPMDQESREKRARLQGYDTSQVLYHGTGAGRTFDEFSTGRSMMVFFTPNQAYAADYGETEGYYIRPGKQFDMYNNPEHAAMAIKMFNDKGGWRDAVELNGADLGRTDYNYNPELDLQWEMLDEPETDILSDLANMGYTSFVFQERPGIPAVGVLDPKDIRSVDAAFNPAPEQVASPRVLAQQNLSNIELVEDRIDPAGNILTITEDAGVLWNEQQARQKSIENLRKCLRA
jgi:hypothetical protein